MFEEKSVVYLSYVFSNPGEVAYILVDCKNLAPKKYEDLTEALSNMGLEYLHIREGNTYSKTFKVNRAVLVSVKKHEDDDEDHSRGFDPGVTIGITFSKLIDSLNALGIMPMIKNSFLEDLRAYLAPLRALLDDITDVAPEFKNVSSFERYLEGILYPKEEAKHRERTPKLDSKPRVESKAMGAEEEENLTRAFLKELWVCNCNENVGIPFGEECFYCTRMKCRDCGSMIIRGATHECPKLQ
jgi:hypothetical protein